MANDTAIDLQAIRKTMDEGFNEYAEKLEARGLSAAQKTEVRELVKGVATAQSVGEALERIDTMNARLNEMNKSVTAQEVAKRERRFSDNKLRIRAAGNPLDGKELSAAEFERVMYRGAAMHGRAQALEAAIAETEYTRDDVDAHFDALNQRMAHTKKRGLDPVLKFARDTALGRTLGSLEIETRAVDSEGSRDDYVPTLVSSELWADVILMSRLLEALPTMPMASQAVNLPFWDANIYNTINRVTTLATGAGELDGVPQNAVGSAHAELRAGDLAGYQQISNNIRDDSAPALMMGFLDEFRTATAIATEDAIINADNRPAANNVNRINGAAAYDRNSAATHPPSLIGWRGIRSLVNDTITAGAAFAMSHIRAARRALGLASISPLNFVYLMGGREYHDGLGIQELAQFDMFGALNALATGELPMISRTPVIVSEAYPTAFADDGDVDSGTPANNTTGAIHAIVPQLMMVGIRKMPTITAQPASGNTTGMAVDVNIHTRLAFAQRSQLRAGRQANVEVVNITRA